jgi:hypothetical protein
MRILSRFIKVLTLSDIGKGLLVSFAVESLHSQVGEVEKEN